MLYTTFNLLEPSGNDNLVEKIEEYTGSRVLYGMNTPITSLEINQNIGLETAATAINYSATDPNEASKTIAIEWIKATVAFYNQLYPGDSRVFDLMYFCEQYRINTGVTADPRVDYCGDVIPGGDADANLASINDLITALTALSASIDIYDFTLPLYEFYIDDLVIDASAEAFFESIDPDSFVNEVISEIDGVTGYSTASVADLMANDELVGHSDFEYRPSNTQYLNRVTFRYTAGDGAFDMEKQAAKEYIDAAITAAQMVIGDVVAALPTIYRSLVTAYELYGANQQLEMGPLMTRLRDIAGGGWTPPMTQLPELEPYMTSIMDDELNLRASLLRDLSFVNSYGDTDLSGFLTEEERAALETEVNARRREQRKASARAFIDDLQPGFEAWADYAPTGLGTIFDTYVV
jgi:hypothetical protein